MLADLWSEFKGSTASGMSAPRGTFSLTTLGRGQSKSDYPELARSVKAAAVEVIPSFIAHKYWVVHQPGGEHSRLVAVCTWAMADFICRCDAADQMLQPTEAQERHLLIGCAKP